MIKEKNVGISILRIIMCFEVILVHYWFISDINTLPVYLIPFEKIRLLAVPVFFIISFMLIGNIMENIDINKIKKRMCRLFIPYVGWALIYFFILRVAYLLGISADKPHGKDLLYQLLTGSSFALDPPLWFHADLIVLTIILFFVFFCIKNTEITITFIGLGTLFCIYLQYSGINVKFFSEYPIEFKYTFGRIAETLPFAYLGFLLYYFDIILKLKTYWYHVCFLALGSIAILYTQNIFQPLLADYSYGGFEKIFLALMIVLIFISIPFQTLPEYILTGIDYISKYTMGIYCIHWMMGIIINNISQMYNYKTNSFSLCILNFFISLLIAILLDKILIWKNLGKKLTS